MSSEGSALKRCCFICCIAVMLLLICLIPFADVNRGSPDAEHDEAISEPMVAAATETADTRDKRAVKLSLKVAHEATDARDKAVVAQEAAVAAGMVAVDRAPLQEIDLNELGPPEQKAPQTTDATAPLTGAVKQNGPEEVPVDEVVEEPSEQQIADAVAAAAEKAADQSDRAAAAAAAAASPVALAANVAAKREKPAEQAPLTPAAQVMPAAEAAPAAPPAERAVEPAAEPPAEKSAEPATAPEKAAKRPAGAAETAAAPVEKAAELAAAPAEKAAEPAAPVPVTPHSSQKASELAIAPTGSATAAVAEKAAEQAAATPAAEKAVHHPGAASVASKKDAQNGPPIYFLQFEGPPGLNRTEDGKWSIKSPVFCLSLLTAAYHKVDLHIIGPGRVLQDQKAGKGPALLQYISKIPDGSLVIFYDAQDVFVLHNTAAILEVCHSLSLSLSISLSLYLSLLLPLALVHVGHPSFSFSLFAHPLSLIFLHFLTPPKSFLLSLFLPLRLLLACFCFPLACCSLCLALSCTLSACTCTHFIICMALVTYVVLRMSPHMSLSGPMAPPQHDTIFACVSSLSRAVTCPFVSPGYCPHSVMAIPVVSRLPGNFLSARCNGYLALCKWQGLSRPRMCAPD